MPRIVQIVGGFRRRLGRAAPLGLAASLLSGIPASWAQSGIFSDGFALGHPCRWSVSPPAIDCSGAGLQLALPGGGLLDLVRIPAGTFQMGSPESERGRATAEDLHQVTLTQDYFIGWTEVTQSQWEAVVGDPMPSDCGDYGSGPAHPAYCVSWNDVAGPGGFLELLNAHLVATGQPAGLRLPTDAEWERAARAETQTRFSHGDVLDCDDSCGACAAHSEAMWWCGDQPTYACQETASRLPNGYGLADLHGNVWEWVSDWYQESLGTTAVENPTGPASGTEKVYRGGSWASDAHNCRSAVRFGIDPSSRINSIGFRVARSAP